MAGPLRHTAAYIISAPPLGVEETQDLVALRLLTPKETGLPAHPAVQLLPTLWDQQEQAAGLVGPPGLDIEETEGLPVSLHLLESKLQVPGFPTLHVLPFQYDQQEQASGLVGPITPDEDFPPAHLATAIATLQETSRTNRVAVLHGVGEGSDQKYAFISVGFPYDTLTGAAPTVSLVYDTVGLTTIFISLPYDTNPGPSVTVRFPYDVAQPTPAWPTSPFQRRTNII